MTWLSDRSGIASIGVAASAHQPQPARPMYNATTMKRFFSDSSMSRLIMSHDTRHAVRSAHGDTPQEQHPGRHTTTVSGLNEENGEQDVLWNVSRR